MQGNLSGNLGHPQSGRYHDNRCSRAGVGLDALMAHQTLWGKGLVLAVSGFEKPERRQIELIVSSAGGEYSTALSRRCTVLLVPQPSPDLRAGLGSRKLELFFKNGHKHKAKLLVKAWLLDCQARGVLLDMAAYEVLPQVCTSRKLEHEVACHKWGAN